MQARRPTNAQSDAGRDTLRVFDTQMFDVDELEVVQEQMEVRALFAAHHPRLAMPLSDET